MKEYFIFAYNEQERLNIFRSDINWINLNIEPKNVTYIWERAKVIKLFGDIKVRYINLNSPESLKGYRYTKEQVINSIKEIFIVRINKKECD